MSPGLAPLSPTWWPPVDLALTIDPPSLQEQVCFYGFCLTTDGHSEDCETYTPMQIAAARLHWKLKVQRARMMKESSTCTPSGP